MARPRKIQQDVQQMQEVQPAHEPDNSPAMIECLWHSIGTNRGKLAQGEIGEIDADEVEVMTLRASEGKVRFV